MGLVTQNAEFCVPRETCLSTTAADHGFTGGGGFLPYPRTRTLCLGHIEADGPNRLRRASEIPCPPSRAAPEGERGTGELRDRGREDAELTPSGFVWTDEVDG